MNASTPTEPRIRTVAGLDAPALFTTLYALLSLLQVDVISRYLLLAAAVVLLPGLFMGRRDHPPLYRQAWNAASLLFVGAILAASWITPLPSYVVLIYICLFLLLHRWLNRRGLKEYLEIWCLGALLMLVGGMKGGGLLGLVVTVGWGISTIQLLSVAAVTRGWNASGRPAGSPYRIAPLSLRVLWGLIPIMLMVSGIVFVLAPRLRTPQPPQVLSRMLSPAERSAVQAGFSETVNLRSMSSIQQTNAIAFRILSPPPQLSTGQVRFRMGVLDEFDGWEWNRAPRTGEPHAPIVLRDTGYRLPMPDGTVPDLPPNSRLEIYTLRIVDLPGRLVPMPETAIAFGGLGTVSDLVMEHDGRVTTQQTSRPRDYQVVALVSMLPSNAPPLLRGPVLPQHLEIPPMLRSEAANLAARIPRTGNEPHAARARSIHTWLRRNGQYTLDVGYLDDGPEALRVFMSDTLTGHCELFATTMALLLRSEGIPSRLVTGFSGADPLPGSSEAQGTELLVGHRHAHAWVEAYLPEEGWARFDPTPPPPLAASTLDIAGTNVVRPGLLANAGLLTAVMEGYGAQTQRKFVAAARERLMSALRTWEGGALLRLGTRFKNNAREPFIIALALFLAAFNLTAWIVWRSLPNNRRKRTLQQLGDARGLRTSPLFLEVLERLGVTDTDRVARSSPREVILAGSPERRLAPSDAIRLADLYSEWRYGSRDPRIEKEVRQLLAGIRGVETGK